MAKIMSKVIKIKDVTRGRKIQKLNLLAQPSSSWQKTIDFGKI